MFMLLDVTFSCGSHSVLCQKLNVMLYILAIGATVFLIVEAEKAVMRRIDKEKGN